MPAPFSEADYTVEIDHVAKTEWSSAIQQFEDISIYQTWEWGKLSAEEERLSHMVVYRDGQPVSMAQVKLSRVPLLGRGVASVAWGPLWLKRDAPVDRNILRETLRFLRGEYVVNRKLLLIIKPSVTGLMTGDVQSVFREEDFRESDLHDPYHTLVMDISQPLDSLRAGVKRQWRQKLNRAEKSDLEVESGPGSELFEPVRELYAQMLARKQFTNIADLDFYANLQDQLDARHKLQILVCRHRGKPTAGLVFSPLGKASLALIAATGDYGMDLNGSFLLWWKAIEYLKEHGHQWLDLCGINPTGNPGGYQFKSGLCGRWGCEILSAEYQCCDSFLSWKAAQYGNCAKRMRNCIKSFVTMKRHVLSSKSKNEAQKSRSEE